MWLLIIITVIGIFAAIEMRIYSKKWHEGLSAHISFSTDRAVEGDSIELIEVVEQRGKLPLPWLTLKFQISRDIHLPDSSNASVTDYYNREDIFSIKRDQKITRRLPAICAKRGFHRVHSVDLLSTDMLMAKKLVWNIGGKSHVTVYPKMTDIPELHHRVRSIMGDFVVRTALNQDPFFFKGLRDYVPGDSVRHVNWRATARTDELVVNEFDYTSSKYATVWLNIDNDYNWIDHNIHEESIRIAASLIDTLIADGIPVGLRSNAADIVTGDRIFLSPGNSPEHCDNCMTALARIQLEKDPPPLLGYFDELTGAKSSDELIIIISSYQSPELIEKLRQLEQMSDRDVLWIKPVRVDDYNEYTELSVLKNACIWRVDCD